MLPSSKIYLHFQKNALDPSTVERSDRLTSFLRILLTLAGCLSWYFSLNT